MVKLTSHQSKRAFTLIELLVSVAIIAVLARLIALSLTAQRSASRDATRRAALTQYSTALEQYYTQAHSYMVVPTSAGCTVTASTTDTYPGNPSAPLPEGPLTKCVGYMGGGWGSINRRSMASYGSKAISEELRSEGFIQTISFDPRTNGNFPTQTAAQVVAAKGIANFDDYILTLCDSNGNPASDPSTATEYGLYAELESNTAAAVPGGTGTKTSCGGASTGSGGWDTVQ